MAYEKREKKREQERWEIGAYIKTAINSSIFACIIADESTPNKLPSFPEMPYKNETKDDKEMTKEEIEAERLKAYMFFQNLKKQ